MRNPGESVADKMLIYFPDCEHT